MPAWTYKEIVEDWINDLDERIISQSYDEEPGYNHKTIILDSILVCSYLREVKGNISASEDYRLQKLFEICTYNCGLDYYHRFLKYIPRHYSNREDLWWLDCWESIRLNNILHELNYRDIHEFFSKIVKWWSMFRRKMGEIFCTRKFTQNG
jgi:hypothetical protein